MKTIEQLKEEGVCIPLPLYSCDCGDDVYEPQDLFLYKQDGENYAGFYCDHCIKISERRREDEAEGYKIKEAHEFPSLKQTLSAKK